MGERTMNDNFSETLGEEKSPYRYATCETVERTYSKTEIKFAFIAIALGYLFIKLCIASMLSLGAAIFFILLICVSSYTVKKCGIKQSSRNMKLMFMALFFSLYFALSSNMIIKMINMVFVLILIMLWAYSLNNDGYKGADDNFIFVSGKATLGEPASNFAECSHAVSYSMKDNKKGKNIQPEPST
jgi:hypothetical protein